MKQRISLYIAIIFLVCGTHTVSARYMPGLDWRTIRTDRVTIYYPSGHERFAQRVLSLTDEVTDDITSYLDVSPRKCPIVLNPYTDLFNGYYEPIPNRISLYETPPYSLRWFGPVSDGLDQVYTHEYMHYAHITTKRGWYGALASVLGDGLALANGLSSGWFVEGIAVQAETWYTDGGRGRSPFFDGQVRSFSEGDGFWNLSASMSSSPYHPSTSRIYQAGYYLTDYLTQTYGEQAIAKMVQRQAQHPVGGFRSALKHITGLSPGTFFQEYLDDMSKRISQAKERTMQASLPAGRAITDNLIDSYDTHVWTEQGTINAVRTGYERPDALVEIDPHTGDILHEIETGRLDRISGINRTEDGRLVYGRYVLHPLGEGDIIVTDIGVYDPDDGSLERITHNAHIFSADLSPDGTQYIAARRNGMWIDLVQVSADGDTATLLVSEPGLLFESPLWSPDGRDIVAVAKVDECADIVFVDPVTGEITPLFTPDIYEDNEPSFSPDGRWIVFSSDREGSWDIYAWNIADKELFRLTAVPYVAGDPHVSPDGTMLSFSSLIRGVKQLCVLPFEPYRGTAIPVTAGGTLPSPNLERVAPDIAFESQPAPLWDMYRPFIHTPWLGYDEDGGSLGVMVMGADPMKITGYQASILYGMQSGRPGYDITLYNRSLWPELTLHMYDTAEENNPIGGGRSYWYREHGGELSASLNVIHRTAPDILRSYISIGGRYRSFEGLQGVMIHPDFDQSAAVFGTVAFSRYPDMAPRDMVPGWGQDLSVTHEEAISSSWGELPGYNTIFSFRQYMPLPLQHQGLALKTVFQRQSGMLSYARDMSIPRGYRSDDNTAGLNRSKNLLFSADWRFPLGYPDTGLGLIAWHMYQISGTVFIDYGAGWNTGFDMDNWLSDARTSFGGAFTVQGDAGAWLPIETGFSIGYKTKENEYFTDILFSIRL